MSPESLIRQQIRRRSYDINDGSLTVFFCDIPQSAAEIECFVELNRGYLSTPLENAAPKRQAEFIAGRLACAAALLNAGFEAQLVPGNPDRSPAWPSGLAGSISHKNGLAVAAVSQHFPIVGLDLEIQFSEKTIQRISKKIISAEEHHQLATSEVDFQLGFTQIFSAKEALYKGIYPYIQRYIGFDTCQMTHISAQQMTLKLRQDIASLVPHTGYYAIQLEQYQDYLISMLADVEQN